MFYISNASLLPKKKRLKTPRNTLKYICDMFPMLLRNRDLKMECHLEWLKRVYKFKSIVPFDILTFLTYNLKKI